MRKAKPDTCEYCGSLMSAVTWTCVLGQFCPGSKPGALRALHEHELERRKTEKGESDNGE